MAKAIPSTLYQKVKFVVEEQLINVSAEEDIVATLTISNFYIDVNESVIECSFQSLEVVNVTFVGIGQKVPTPQLSNVTRKGVKQTVGKRARAEFKLEKFLQGSLKVVLIIMKYDRYGLGYKPNVKSHNKMMRLKREKRVASLIGASVKREHMVFPHICETFYSAKVQVGLLA